MEESARTVNVDGSDAFVFCDAGGGTVDVISYEVHQTRPEFEVQDAATYEPNKHSAEERSDGGSLHSTIRQKSMYRPEYHPSSNLYPVRVHDEASDPLPRYEAILYFWGRSEGGHILESFMSYMARDSLITGTSDLIKGIFGRRERFSLWVDALCIDQEKDLEERRQVDRLQQMYGERQCMRVEKYDKASKSAMAGLQRYTPNKDSHPRMYARKSFERRRATDEWVHRHLVAMISSYGTPPRQNNGDVKKVIMELEMTPQADGTEHPFFFDPKNENWHDLDSSSSHGERLVYSSLLWLLQAAVSLPIILYEPDRTRHPSQVYEKNRYNSRDDRGPRLPSSTASNALVTHLIRMKADAFRISAAKIFESSIGRDIKPANFVLACAIFGGVAATTYNINAPSRFQRLASVMTAIMGVSVGVVSSPHDGLIILVLMTLLLNFVLMATQVVKQVANIVKPARNATVTKC